MEIITDTEAQKQEIMRCFQRHGHAPEHNYHYCQFWGPGDEDNYFFMFEDSQGIFAKRRKDTWYMISEVLAPEEDRERIFFEFADHVLMNEQAKKIIVEFPDKFRKNVLASVRAKGAYRAIRPHLTLIWPVFDMQKWQGDAMQGGAWKKLRNLEHQFIRDRKIEIVPSQEVSEKKLLGILSDWLRKRLARDHVYVAAYRKLIESGLDGMDTCRTICVDGEPCSITCGWEIPGTRDFYSAIGIYNYRVKGIGEYSQLDDLRNLKRTGYASVNFGGSDPRILIFKNKFKPHSWYRTSMFSIVRI